MARPDKEAAIAALTEQFRSSGAVLLTEYRGLSVALRDFAKDNKQLVIKGGIMDGKLLSAADVDKLASLESREVLLAKTAGAVKASLSKAAYLFAAPASKAVRTVDALREKQEQAA